MATNIEFIEHVCDCLVGVGNVRSRKMFGEYMIYVNEKPILLVCDNTVYVKKIEAVKTILADAPCGIPYDGAKEHYILNTDDPALTRKVVTILEEVTPLPKKKK